MCFAKGMQKIWGVQRDIGVIEKLFMRMSNNEDVHAIMVPACHPTAPIHHNKAMNVLIHTHRYALQKDCMRYGVCKEIETSRRSSSFQIGITFGTTYSVPVYHVYIQIEQKKATEVFIGIHR